MTICSVSSTPGCRRAESRRATRDWRSSPWAEVARVEQHHGETGEDQRHDGHDLDEREPEFQLAEHAHRQQVRAVEDDQRDQRRQPLRHLRKPVAHIDADGGQLRHGDDHPHEPVRPAGDEACERSAELLRVGRKRAGHRSIGEQLPQRAHDEEDRHAAERVGEQQPRAGIVDRLGGAEEQAHADRAADGDELDVAVAQVAREVEARLRHAEFSLCAEWSALQGGGPSSA